MKNVNRVLSNISAVLTAMLLFLVLFQDKISLPPVMQVVGRMHPLLLHLPIGILIFSALLWWFRAQIDESAFQTIFGLTLPLIAFSALLTALMGLFLSREEGYTGDTLYWHRLLSLLFAFGSYGLMMWYQSPTTNKTGLPAMLVVLLALLITGSHQGANLTHGVGFISEPLANKTTLDRPIVTEESSLYQGAIEPIFYAKCVSCHNPEKTKGGLDLTTEAGIAKGGKHGPVWLAGDTASRLLQAIALPLDDKKHMPPDGKTQLTEAEKNVLKQWIVSGADLKKQIKSYLPSDTLLRLASPFIHRDDAPVKFYSFKPADRALIQSLNDPYCAVFPLDQNTPALQVDFFVREKYNPAKLTELVKIKDQVVILNMDNMPVTDADVTTITKFSSVEKIVLNHSSITNKGVETLSAMPFLSSLAISGTAVDASVLTKLQASTSLREVFIWNTKISAADVKPLQSDSSKIHFHLGYIPDPNEVLPLTAPVKTIDKEILATNDSVGLRHQIRGVIIRYTTDGSVPDSATGPVYTSPIPVTKGFTLVKTRAVKEGWLSSPVVDFVFFKQGIQVLKAELLTKPDEKYRGKGGATLIDGKKGPVSNFKDEAWLGFREQPFSALFQVDTLTAVHNITMSIHKNVGSFILLPTEVTIYAGQNPKSLKPIKHIIPPALTKEELRVVKNDAVSIELGSMKYLYYKVDARPVTKLPSWHPGKGEKGWIFMDEVFFN